MTTNPISRKDFLSDTDPRWCPGCGCYSVLKSITDTYAALGVGKENYAVISGIGCSSRFPYYVSTYGFHTIHGRAPTVALGVKMVRPELSVWIMTGDGDALSIGGNHFLHIMRRNPNIKMVLFNNQIYGLTKGQASPTSPQGLQTKSSPFGSIDQPINPMALAISAGATFAARVPDRDGKLMTEVFEAAAHHQGMAFIEVLLNCVIFNDGAFKPLTDKQTKTDTTMILKDGEPIRFGTSGDKGLRMTNQLKLEVVSTAAVSESELLVHDATSMNPTLSFMLAQLSYPESPVPMGIFRRVQKNVYEESVRDLENNVVKMKGKGHLEKLLHSGDTWVVK